MKNFKLVDSDYDFRIYERILIGRITYKRYMGIRRKARFINNTNYHCGCAHDCCGCLCGAGMRLEIIPNGLKIIYSESFNY